MAQTRKRRRTKHRGNAAGMVEARGRTGRRPEETEKRGMRQDAAARRRNRLEEPPTWRSALNRAAIATLVFAALAVLLLGQTVANAVLLAAMLLIIYVPATYYMDLWMHRRWLRKQESA